MFSSRGLFVIGAALAATALFAGPKALKDVVYSTVPAEKGKGAVELKMDVFPCESAGRHPCFVFIHGGGWAEGDKKEVGGFTAMTGQGWVVASVNYRLTDGGKTPFPAQIRDCKAAIRYLRKNAERYAIDPERIVVGGGSAGGHLSALLGVTSGIDPFAEGGMKPDPDSRVAGVIDMFGPTDFQSMLGPYLASGKSVARNPSAAPVYAFYGTRDHKTIASGFAAASPTTYVTKERAKEIPPFLILHSKGDPLVPFAQSEILDGRLRSAGVSSTLRLYDFDVHALPPAAGKDIQEFLTRFVK